VEELVPLELGLFADVDGTEVSDLMPDVHAAILLGLTDAEWNKFVIIYSDEVYNLCNELIA
jgi:hypothetical protein